MFKINNLTKIWALSAALFVAGVGFVGCNDDDDDNGTQIWTIGPGNVDRGGILKISGQKLESVSSVVLPSLDGSGIEISKSEFLKVTDGYIEVKLPNDKNFVSGNVIIKFSDGSSVTSKVSIKVGALVFESFSPATAKAGDEITITGDYLALVESVVFAANQEVKKEDFISQSNSEIVVVLPDAAQSGSIAISDGDGSAYSNDQISVTLPTVTSLSDEIIKAGEILTISGSNLDIVRTVKFDGAEVTAFESQSGAELSVKVPFEAKDGEIFVAPGSGINVEAGEIELVKASILNVTEKANLGDLFNISGTDLDLVGKVLLGKKEQKFEVNEDGTEITFKIDTVSTSGLTVIAANGVEIDQKDAAISVCSDINVESFNGGFSTKITFVGDSGYIAGVKIGGYDVEFEKVNLTTLTTVIPAQVKGESEFVLIGKNGESVTVNKNVTAFAGPVVTSMPDNCKFGSSILLYGFNLDKVTSVKIGETAASDFVNKGSDKLYLTIPALEEEGSYAITVSDGENSSVTYESITIADASVSIWKGSFENTGWGGNQDLAWDGYDWSKVKAGSKLYFYLTQTELEDWGGWQLALRHGQGWGELPSPVYITFGADQKTAIAEFELTQEVLDDLIANGGLVVTGTKFIMTEIKILLP